MRYARAILFYALVVIVVGSLLAPVAYALIHPHWGSVPFKRVFDRVFLIVALLGLWPLLRALEIKSWAGLGYLRSANGWRHWLAGWLIGIVSLSVAGGIVMLTGDRSFEIESGKHLSVIFVYLLTGLAVGVVEETFFRGGVFGALRRGLPLWFAILVSSAIYSVVHFLKPKGGKMDADSIVWSSGFTHLWGIFRDLPAQPGFLAGFVTLLLVGCILAIAFSRTRALYLSMGLHAGWVLMMKTFSLVTEPTGPRQWWNGVSLIDSVWTWPVLIATWILVDYLCRKKLPPLAS